MAKVKIEKVGDRIHAAAPFTYKDRCKSIIGARWSKQAHAWTYPLDLETCRRLRDEFGDELDIGPDLWAWAAVQKEREDELTPLTMTQDLNLLSVVTLDVVPKVAPTMWEAMQQRPYQAVAAKYMAGAVRCLNADQPGIGKTIETLAALVERGVRGAVLVLAPKTSCLTVWPVEIERWYANDVPHTITNVTGMLPKKRQEAWNGFKSLLGPAAGGAPDGIHFLIANAEQVSIKSEMVCPADICTGDEDWCPAYGDHKGKKTVRNEYLHSIEWDAVIADETHKWLINSTGKKPTQVGYGFRRLRVKDGAPMYALSGTPLKGYKWNLFGTLNWLWPKTYTSKWRWIQTYFEVVNEEIWGGKAVGTKVVKKITGKWLDDKAKEAFYRSLGTLMIRRTKDELRKINPDWMPPEKRYHDVWVDMEPAQRRHYREMEKGAEATLIGGRLTATGVLAEMTRLKQFANSDGAMVEGNFKPMLPSAKFSWLIDFLEERGIGAKGELSDDVRKVVVGSQYTSLIKMWSAELQARGIANVMITGETKDSQRAKAVASFQNDDRARVCLINTKAGGVSITLDAADDMVVMDETWNPDDQEQLEDRVHRASNVKHQVDVWYVRTRDTLEEGIAAVNMGKAKSNHVVLDARRGLRFAAERFGATVKEDK